MRDRIISYRIIIMFTEKWKHNIGRGVQKNSR